MAYDEKKKKKKKKIVLGIILVGVLSVAIPLAYAQTTREWVGHMVFRQASPNVSFNGTMTFKTIAGATVYSIGGTTNTPITQNKMYFQSLGPVAMAALTGNIVSTSGSQNFTVTGLSVKDTVFVNGPAVTTLCPPSHWRVAST